MGDLCLHCWVRRKCAMPIRCCCSPRARKGPALLIYMAVEGRLHLRKTLSAL